MHPTALRDEAKEAYCNGLETCNEIAKRLKVDRSTVYQWRKDFDWDVEKMRRDEDREAANRRAAIKRRHEMNQRHDGIWSAVELLVTRKLNPMIEGQAEPSAEELEILETAAKIVERAQRGRRLALGADTEERPETRVEVIAPSFVQMIQEASNGDGNGFLHLPPDHPKAADNGGEIQKEDEDAAQEGQSGEEDEQG